MCETLLPECHTIYTWINTDCEFVHLDFTV